MKMKAVFNWSGGKDSALALQKILQDPQYEVVSLLTTVNSGNQRSSMHAIPVSLLRMQAESLGIPLYIIELAPDGTMEGYASAMRGAVEHFKAMGVTHFIFGDIFLHDVRTYREKQLQPYGIEVVEPLWNLTSEEVMDDFLASGLQTIIVTTMADVLDERFIGRLIDRELLAELPAGMDVCGENGEYHTFCYDGPMFRFPVPYTLGDSLHITHPVKLDDWTTKEYAYWYGNLID